MNIYLEIFGYIGTALVIISMMMTSVLKLRIINMCGGVISLIYAVLTNTWPVAVLNACLVCINFVQTIRQLRKKDSLTFAKVSMSDGSFKYFLSYFENDIKKFSDCDASVLCEDDSVYLIFSASQTVGFVAGQREGTQYKIKMYYAAPQNRNKDTETALFSYLKKEGTDTVIGFDGNNVINI